MFSFLFSAPMLVRPVMKRLLCLKAKNSLIIMRLFACDDIHDDMEWHNLKINAFNDLGVSSFLMNS